jgi:hypothetical protein
MERSAIACRDMRTTANFTEREKPVAGHVVSGLVPILILEGQLVASERR